MDRYILGANPAARISHIPDACASSRTITLNKIGVLQIFRDRRPSGVAWINENLPRLWINNQPDKFLRWFWDEMPQDGWLEFDFGTHVLSLCVLKKNSSK